MNKALIQLAIKLLDTQDGIPIETYDLLKRCLVEAGDWGCREIIDNTIVASKVAFLDEAWIEENATKFE